MNGLILDTSIERSILLLIKDYKPLANIYLHGGPSLSEKLLPTLEKFLEDNGLTIDDIHLIGSGVGPGSYTGLRVGATVAKTLSYARNIPLVGFCSLTGFAPPQEGTFVTAFDARSGGFYVIKGKKEDGKTTFLSLPHLVSFDEAVDLFEKEQMILTPDRDQIQMRFADRFDTIAKKTYDLYPDPKQLAALTQEKYLAGEYSTNGDLPLIYLKNC